MSEQAVRSFYSLGGSLRLEADPGRRSPARDIQTAQLAISEFCDFLRGELEGVVRCGGNVRKAALRAYRLLRQLVHYEVGDTDTEDALLRFMDRLWEGTVGRTLLKELYSECYRLISDSDPGGERRVALLVADLERLIYWYQRRSSLLNLIPNVDGLSAGLIIELETVLGTEHLGLEGLEVRCSVAVSNYQNRSLYISAALRGEDGWVCVRPGWESWGAAPEEDWLGGRRDHSPLSARAALVPSHRKQLLEGVNLFFPFAAGKFPGHAENLSIEAVLGDDQGELLDSASEPLEATVLNLRDYPTVINPSAMGIVAPVRSLGQSLQVNVVGPFFGAHSLSADTFSLKLDCRVAVASAVRPGLFLRARLLDEDGDPLDGCSYKKPSFGVFSRVVGIGAFSDGGLNQTVSLDFSVPCSAGDPVPRPAYAEVDVCTKSGVALFGELVPLAVDEPHVQARANAGSHEFGRIRSQPAQAPSIESVRSAVPVWWDGEWWVLLKALVASEPTEGCAVRFQVLEATVTRSGELRTGHNQTSRQIVPVGSQNEVFARFRCNEVGLDTASSACHRAPAERFWECSVGLCDSGVRLTRLETHRFFSEAPSVDLGRDYLPTVGGNWASLQFAFWEGAPDKGLVCIVDADSSRIAGDHLSLALVELGALAEPNVVDRLLQSPPIASWPVKPSDFRSSLPASQELVYQYVVRTQLGERGDRLVIGGETLALVLIDGDRAVLDIALCPTDTGTLPWAAGSGDRDPSRRGLSGLRCELERETQRVSLLNQIQLSEPSEFN